MADVKLSRRALMTGALATAAAVTLPAVKYASGGFIPPNPCREVSILDYMRFTDWGGPCKYYVDQAQWDFFKAVGYDMTRDFVLVEPIPEC